MALPDYPSAEAAFVAALEDADFLNGGHRTNFIPSLLAALAFAAYGKGAGEEIQTLAAQVANDAASAAAGSGTEASVSDIFSGTNAEYLSIRRIYEAMAPVALTDQATIAVDLDTGINFSLTIGGDRTLGNFTTVTVGQYGFIVVTQDATGGRTLDKASNIKVAGGEIVLDQAPNAVTVLSYFVEASDSILITVSEAFS